MMVCLTGALLCLGYALLIRSAHSGTRFYRVWFWLSACFLLLAVGIRFRLLSMLPPQIRGLLGVAAVCLLLCFLLIEGFVLTGFHRDGPEGLDYIIILGAQVKPTGPCRVLRQRLDRGIRYLEQNPSTLCIVSGGQGSNEQVTEAAGMAAYLTEKGIPRERILLEDRSRTTVENLVNSRPMIPASATVGIITNDFHLARALQIGRRHGFTEAQGIAAPSARLYLPNNMLREYFAMLLFLLRGI